MGLAECPMSEPGGKSLGGRFMATVERDGGGAALPPAGHPLASSGACGRGPDGFFRS